MTSSKVICGHPTDRGPCNMKKGHAAPFHRVREYRRAVEWLIRDANDNYKILDYGHGRVELGYALTHNLQNHDNLLIEIAR